MDNEDGNSESTDTDHPRAPRSSDFEDHFWLVLLALIVVVLFVVGLLGADSGGGHGDGYTGWH